MKAPDTSRLIILFSIFISYVGAQTCQPPNAIPQPTFNHVHCYDVNDTVNANPNANTHYTYLWSTGATTPSIVLLQAQDFTFTVTVTDPQNNCSAVFSGAIVSDDQISNTNLITVQCSETSGANLQIYGVGGDSTYTYTLVGIAKNKTGFFPNLSIGTDTFIITDGLGCTEVSPIEIPNISPSAFKVITDSGICSTDGFIIVTSVDTPGAFTLQYQLDGGNFISSDTFNDVSPGKHTIVVQNIELGCDDTFAVIVYPPTGISIAQPIYNSPVCLDFANDTVNANPTGNANYGFSWFNGDTGSYIVTGPGYFSVTVTDRQANCSVVFSDIIKPEDDSLRAYFILYPDSTTPNHWYLLNLATGTGPLTYRWDWDDGSSADTGISPSHTYNGPGNYYICLTVTDVDQCSITYCDSSTYIHSDQNQVIYVNVVTQLPAGIPQVGYTTPGVSVFPDPAGNRLIISAAGFQPQWINVYDLNGKMCSKGSLPRS